MTDYVLTCALENVQPDASCSAPVWTAMPQPILPSLTLEEGAQVAFAIVSVWLVGLAVRLYVRSTRQAGF